MTEVQLYKRIESEIDRRIRRGVYPVGSRLPTERELGQEFDTSRLTVAKGLAALISSGQIERIRGKGTFVRADGAPASATPKPEQGGGLFTFVSPLPGEHEAAKKPGVLEGMHAAIRNTGFSVGVEFYSTLEEAVRILRNHARPILSGYVVWPVLDDSFAEELQRLRRSEFPFVLVDSCFPGVDADYIVSDNILAVELVIAHLYGLGHRRISYLTIQPDRLTTAECLAGVLSGLSRRALPFESNIGIIRNENLVNTQLHAARNRDAIAEWLRRQLATPEPPTAIFCSNDSLALTVLSLLAEWGIDVPGRISVAGLDNIERSDLIPVPLTTVEKNSYEMGYRAVKALQSRLAPGEGVSLAYQCRLPPTLIERASTAPVCD